MQKIGFLVGDGFQIMGIAAQSVFEYANFMAEQPIYAISVLSELGGPVKSSLGMVLQTEPFGRKVFDTLIVIGDNTTMENSSAGLLRFVKNSHKTSRRIASICTGAFVLAKTGLLDGRRATTHWFYAQELEKTFPAVKVEQDRIFIIDGPIWTSAGMTAGLDLALALVEKDLGIELASSVAKKLVMHQRRAGGQSQHSELLELAPKSDRVQSALTFAKKNLESALTVEQLAEVANLSPRQFSRAFRAETGESPAKAIEKLRLESARLLIEQSRHSLDAIATQSGFVDRRRMREAFLRGFGQSPQVFRRRARMEAQ